MTVLIAFATVEGQTGKIARYIEGLVQASGRAVRVVDTSDPMVEVSFEGVDKVILAASVHERKHPKPFEVFLSAQAEDLAARDTLLLSVSLSAAFPEGIEEAHDYVVEMKMRTGLETKADVLVAGAIKRGRYDFYEMQVLRHVVLRGREFDATKAEHEFTDWNALRMELDRFLA